MYDVICRADDPRWLSLRNDGLGASDMPVVLGCSPWKAGFELFGEKAGIVEPPNLDGNEFVRWGKLLEPVILAEYEERTGRPVYPSGELLRSREHPWAQCTLDGRTVIDGNGKRTPLEAKNTSAFKSNDWQDGAPEIYRVQVHHQMLVTGEEIATIACLLGGNRLIWEDIERDDTLIRKIIHHGEEFWRRLQEKNPPAPDGSEASKRALAALYPLDDGQTIDLSAGLADVVEEFVALKADKKAVESNIRAAENRIKSALGDAQLGLLPSGWAVSWKSQERDGYTVEPSSYRVLRTHKPKT